ncbi:MAG: hypothetical protein DSM106950_17215 [Stigonema ocellatum SAG 48.90 = DSM 106950]|nr:hypothetical protein [Stigonema ocellatum SAG 48.90 = DSM 106950]
MTKPFTTANPQDFKLHVYWVVGTVNNRMVAEFSDCRWLPRLDETLVLPTDESNCCQSWQKFKVVDIVYDFQKQSVRVWCKPLSAIPQRVSSDFEKKVEARMEAMEAKAKAQKLEAQTRLEYELAQIDEEDMDEELERLKAEILGQIKKVES